MTIGESHRLIDSFSRNILLRNEDPNDIPKLFVKEYVMKTMKKRIQEVNSQKASIIIQARTPQGLFIQHNGDSWIGIDNSTGDAWTEEFNKRETCVSWLMGEIEMSDIYDDMEGEE
jgi:hypothetical protein